MVGSSFVIRSVSTLINAIEIATEAFFVAAGGLTTRFGLNGGLHARRQLGKPRFPFHSLTICDHRILASGLATTVRFLQFTFFGITRLLFFIFRRLSLLRTAAFLSRCRRRALARRFRFPFTLPLPFPSPCPLPLSSRQFFPQPRSPPAQQSALP